MAKKGFRPDADTEVQGEEALLTLNGMYREYFLDYASYVILERAIPAIDDGLKPVQRRILQSFHMEMRLSGKRSLNWDRKIYSSILRETGETCGLEIRRQLQDI